MAAKRTALRRPCARASKPEREQKNSVTENEEQLLYVACRSNGIQRISAKAMSMHYVIEFARMSKRNSQL